MSNRERFVHIFESQPLLPNNFVALSQYMKALVSLDKLDDSPLLKEVVVSTTNSLLLLIDFVQHTCSLFKSIPSVYELELILSCYSTPLFSGSVMVMSPLVVSFCSHTSMLTFNMIFSS
jgi:hypothetical protein